MGLKIGRESKAKLAAALGTGVAVFGVCASSAAAAPVSSHGNLLQPFNTNQSTNWFGYNQGTQEQGGKQFHSVTSDWNVPTASQHIKGQSESSSSWTGIGGGCTDANCSSTDPTLIQTGTEQDVDSSGKPSYSAWWETIPAPSNPIKMNVQPGDHMHADIHESSPGSEMWTITLKNVTRNETFTTNIPYLSTYGTAEWINETPLELGGSGGAGQAALPNLTKTPFDLSTTNGAPAGLKPSEEMQLVDNNGNVIGSPSAPDPDADGFNACTWTTTCAAPTGS
jgi:hypothetical protein